MFEGKIFHILCTFKWRKLPFWISIYTCCLSNV